MKNDNRFKQEPCYLLDANGNCCKYGQKTPCDKSRATPEWFTDHFEECKIEEVCKYGSIFGNYHFVITTAQIEALKKGQVLHYDDEYGIFIKLENPAEESAAEMQK